MASATVAGAPHAMYHRTPLSSPSISTMRRKPQITYQSPSSYYIPSSLRIEGPARSSTNTNASSSTSSSSDSGSATQHDKKRKAKKADDENEQKKQTAERVRYTMGPPLPLYHPLGRLALSLPELDPTALGLPPLPASDPRRSSARARRPPAKLREVDQEEADAAPAIAAAAPAEAREKASPKKKGGARPGAGVKRKRKEADEDATYPAKKTRGGRGDRPPSEAASPPETVMAPPEPPSPEPVVEAPEEKKPERRSTRSARGTLLRRDSSASEATSVSASLVAKAPSGKSKGDESTNSSAGEGKQAGRHRTEPAAASLAD